MTYSIIPPILVVLSIIGIILFLMKKAPEVALLEEKEELSRKKQIWKGNFLRRRAGQPTAMAPEGGGSQRSLIFLEKITRKMKLIFLKLENKFTSWNESIRSKRKGRRVEFNKPENESYSRTLENLRNYDFNREKENAIEEEKVIPVTSARTVERPSVRPPVRPMEEKVVRPILSEKIIKPRVRVETKDRLEKILIERIAANPKDTEAYERLGEYYFEAGNLIDAKECFKQVIKLDPMNMDVKFRMRKLERLL